MCLILACTLDMPNPDQTCPPLTYGHVAARALATYSIPGCVGRGARLGSESSSGGGVWKSGNLETWGPGNPEIWGPQNQKKNFKIQIRSAQNVGKVWISRKKSSRPYFGPSEAIFSMDRKNQKHAKKMPIFLGGPMGPWQSHQP